jgi:hypothetical protein
MASQRSQRSSLTMGSTGTVTHSLSGFNCHAFLLSVEQV